MNEDLIRVYSRKSAAKLWFFFAESFGVFLDEATELNKTFEIAFRTNQLLRVNRVGILDHRISDKRANLLSELDERIFHLRLCLHFHRRVFSSQIQL